MRIAVCASEGAPYAKSGGLGDLIAFNASQCGRQCLHYVAQTAGLGVRGAFGGTDGNSHTVSPRLMMMGFLAVP